MAYLRRKYYYRDEDIPVGLSALYTGFSILEEHPLFSQLDGTVLTKSSHLNGRESISCVTRSGDIFVNIEACLDAQEWAYVLAHNLLHLAFGHFDKDKMPLTAERYPLVWNKACDIYITRFLADIGFGKAIFEDPACVYSIKLNDEIDT